MAGLGLGLGVAEFLDNSRDPYLVLDLNYAGLKSLGTRESFSRASSGTYFNASGVLTSAGTNVARFDHVYNGTSWVSRGLLVEEQRTNLILQSSSLSTSPWSNTDYTITSATSPDGTSNAQKLVAPASNASRRMEQSVTGTAASYSLSFFAKSAGWDFVQICYGWNSDYVNFDLANGVISNSSGSTVGSIQNIGNGWYRCIGTFTAGASTQGIRIIPMATSIASRFPNTTGDGINGILVFGVQFELGAFPTSYIPTTTASVTRSADVCQITGTDFSGFWNGTEGTLAVEFDRMSASHEDYFATAYGGSTSQTVRYFANASNNFEMYTWNAGYEARFQYGPMSAGILNKAAYAYKQNDFAGSLNGSVPQTDNSGVIPTSSNLFIGNYDGTSVYMLCGHIARLRYYNARLTNARLQELST